MTLASRLRFDRVGQHRVGYVSALMMFEVRDGNAGTYLDIGSTIEQYSPTATADLNELWRRIALSVLISNTDDHLRTTGFCTVAVMPGNSRRPST